MSKLISIMLGILFLASCGEHTELEQPIVNDGEIVAVTKEIQVSVLPMQRVGGGSTRSAWDKPEAGEAVTVTYHDAATTRAVDWIDKSMTAAESKIHNAYVVQFNGTSPSSTAAWVSGDVKSQLSSGAAINCNFAMTAGIKNRVYVIANRTTAPTKGMTLADFEAPVALAPSQNVPATGLPCSAMQDVNLGDVYGEVFDVFQLRGLLAKLCCSFSANEYFYGGCNAVVTLKGLPSGYSFYPSKPGDDAVRPAGMGYTEAIIDTGWDYYVPENLSGRNYSLTYAYERAVTAAPANSFYMKGDVEISDIDDSNYIKESLICSLLLGDGSASDFNFLGGCYYYIYAYIAGVDETDLRIKRK